MKSTLATELYIILDVARQLRKLAPESERAHLTCIIDAASRAWDLKDKIEELAGR